MRKLDLTGQRFGMLVALELMGRNERGMARWRCRCDCGAEAVKTLGNLRSGHSKSCGCLRSTTTAREKTAHGMYGTPTYKSWSGMLTRCNNPRNHKYPAYGGRGIKVCERWHAFENFLADMGERPPGTTIGRIDNDGHYEPENCQWETGKDQGRNKRNSRRFEFDGITATIGEHCERLGISASSVRSRIYTYGWDVDRAFATPIKATKKEQSA